MTRTFQVPTMLVMRARAFAEVVASLARRGFGLDLGEPPCERVIELAAGRSTTRSANTRSALVSTR